jgi:transcriptional regulator with XRE-family HTH domain
MNRFMEVDGMRLKELRRRRALSQRELARLSGVSFDTIAKLERGHREAQPRTVRRLSEALNVQPPELIKEEGRDG